MTGYDKDPAFIRNGKYWNEAPTDIQLPEHHHSHDKAWLISVFHNTETKQHGMEYKPMCAITGVQRERWMGLYSKRYANTLDANEQSMHASNIARRAANAELLTRIKNTSSRQA